MELHKCILYEEYVDTAFFNKFQKRIYIPEYNIVVKFNNVNSYYELEFKKSIDFDEIKIIKIIFLKKEYIENLQNKILNKTLSEFRF